MDPLNVDQWRFFVVPTAWLAARKRSQHSITLASLERERGEPVGYSGLRAAVAAARPQPALRMPRVRGPGGNRYHRSGC